MSDSKQKRTNPANERGVYDPPRQLGRVNDEDWNLVKSAAKARGEFFTTWAMRHLLAAARRELSKGKK